MGWRVACAEIQGSRGGAGWLMWRHLGGLALELVGPTGEQRESPGHGWEAGCSLPEDLLSSLPSCSTR